MKKLFSTICMVFVFTVSIMSVHANDMDLPQMSEEQQAMMERFQAYSMPNENHTVLGQLEGNWNAKISHWMSPDAPAEVSIGKSAATMTMDGRFLEQNFTGDWMGQPFIGKGIYGFDNITKKFTSIWYDNFGTGIMTSEGTYEAETNTISEKGSVSCPITNAKRGYRAETIIIDENNYIYETYMHDENGKEFRAMMIEYTREG